MASRRVLASNLNEDDKQEEAKFNLWLRGEFSFDTTDDGLLQAQQQAPLRHGPVRDVRRRIANDMKLGDSSFINNGWDSILNIRGGDIIEEDAGQLDIDKQLMELGIKFGQPFIDAIEQVSIIYIYLYCILCRIREIQKLSTSCAHHMHFCDQIITNNTPMHFSIIIYSLIYLHSTPFDVNILTNISPLYKTL